MNRRTQHTLARLLALVFVLGLSASIFYFRDRLGELSVYGYTGVFLFAFLQSATVVLPAPVLFVVYALGSVLNPVGVGVAAGVGSAIGEISGYLAGYSGREVVENVRMYERIRDWIQDNPRASGWLLLLLA